MDTVDPANTTVKPELQLLRNAKLAKPSVPTCSKTCCVGTKEFRRA